MKNSFKLKLVAAAVLMASGVAHAGIANVPGDGSVANPYLMGVIGASPSVLAATVTGSPTSFFEEFANFTIPTLSTTSGSANTYSLNIGGINVAEITGLTVEVWDDTHPSGSTLFATLSGNNATNLIGDLAAGQYHLDISGNLGSSAHIGQYSVALQALPVPEPETYAMLLAGLGLVGFSIRRRKIA
ncbi:FxDxF family PEP-CTERM protein [Nitrosomonas sp. Nm166]|uniref:FxDxF family PEP-CTERM protein n=1 Tax=Nitrosomonas sp. Nm166 TaxID=1881054 RepID=UPI0008E8F640|nr:FxDxF family PEP-CTERM protein [Nitrosomonas sp. Nm166]SFD90856.1 PEP-CTERM protein-sorting domain-containing protein [Nitrosomonas sp. Nm166]